MLPTCPQANAGQGMDRKPNFDHYAIYSHNQRTSVQARSGPGPSRGAGVVKQVRSEAVLTGATKSSPVCLDPRSGNEDTLMVGSEAMR